MINTGCNRSSLTARKPGRIVLKTSGEILEGLDLRGCSVDVQAHDCQIRNCLFDASADAYFLARQYPGKQGLIFQNNTCDGEKKPGKLAAPVSSDDGWISIRNNLLTGMPADAIGLACGEVIENEISSLGWQPGAHADGIQISRTTGPIQITRNVIDLRPEGAPAGGNFTIWINPREADIEDVSILANTLLGGPYTLAVTEVNQIRRIRRVTAVGNHIGAGQHGPLYPTARPADFVFKNNTDWMTGELLVA